ncbi:MAG: glycoside hydrolase family 13 protein [Balneolales bacterium]
MTLLFQPPEWAKKVVWYQIMPERFRSGDSDNFPQAADQKGAWPHDHLSPLQPHSWGADWYKKQPYEQENELDIWLNIQRRRYGGDLQGIIDKLDYLKELGIGALYLNPIFDSPSHHKYDAASFHHVDPNFGPDPEGDRRIVKQETPEEPHTWVWTSADKLLIKLIEEVHKRGMRIILDGVFNHMGLKSWIYLDVAGKQQKSKYKDWLAVTQWDDFEKGKTFDVKTWEGYNELPEFRQDENGLVEGPRQYIFEITRRWMDPHGNGDLRSGVDGWRLDVAYCIRHPFWKAWRKHVRSINPEAYLVAEVIDNIEEQKPFLKGDEFDAVMNYNFAFACTEFFIRDKNRLSTRQFDSRLRELREAYNPETTYVMQNLLDSHDTDRVASRIVNRHMASIRKWREYYFISKGENPDYNTRKPGLEENRILKLMVLFQMTYPGAPMVYYGSEAGMFGANDPCCRKPMIWPDIEYENDATGPDLKPRSVPQRITFDDDLYYHYRRLIHLRNTHEALQLGDFRTVLTEDAYEIYAYSRSYKDKTVLIVINNSAAKREVKFSTGKGEVWEDLINQDQFFETDNSIKLDLEYTSARILLKGH